jgi:hypothetical protein
MVTKRRRHAPGRLEARSGLRLSRSAYF